MSQQNDGMKAFVAGEALEAFRRVKLSSSEVVYADQSDSDNYIGTTQEKVSDGDMVTVRLKGTGRTSKMVASEAVAEGASLYAADDGKVSDTASGNVIGKALEASTADGDVIEVLPDVASVEVDGASTSVEAEDANGSIPVVFKKQGITDANTAAATIVTSLPFKCKIIDWWLISRDTTAGNVKLQNGTPTDLSANVAKGTADDTLVRGGTIVDATDELAAGSALKVYASAAAAFDVFVMVVRVA